MRERLNGQHKAASAESACHFQWASDPDVYSGNHICYYEGGHDGDHSCTCGTESSDSATP